MHKLYVDYVTLIFGFMISGSCMSAFSIFFFKNKDKTNLSFMGFINKSRKRPYGRY